MRHRSSAPRLFYHLFRLRPKDSWNPTVAVLILASVLLTGFGVFDRIAQWAGAGVGVPVTGFANSITSAALEHKSEGYVLGVGGTCSNWPGRSSCLVSSAFVIGLIKTLWTMGG